jgi:hypothetical protein
MRALTHFAVAVAASAAFAAAGARAQSDQNVAADAAIACLDVEDAESRLACLESAAKELKATRIRKESAEESAAAEALTAPIIAADDASEEDLFGAEALDSAKREKREKDRTTRLVSRVVELRVNPHGDITAVLENGQVWRQLSGDDTVIRLPKKDKVFTASIKRGPLGNYMMTIAELKRTIRVRRIK